MKLGFTGTQNGMTPMQVLKIAQFIAHNVIDETHSGDCWGADSEFLELINLANKNKNFRKIKTIGHIPTNNSKRAFRKYDEERVPKPYLDRNKAIVDECDYLIAAPKESLMQLSSGTWSIVRQAKRVDRIGMIVYPDGRIEAL